MQTATVEAPAAAGLAHTQAAAAANQLIEQAQASSQFRLDLTPRNFDEAWRMAEILAASDMVPKDFRNKPGNCLIAMQWGAELGLHFLQAIQNIAVINGRPALWGDAMLALVKASPLCEWVHETIEGNRGICRVKRRGDPHEHVREFTLEDAQKSGLLGKDGPWKQYTKRMLQLRARAWALRDVFTDVLKGIGMAEELRDLPPGEQFMGMADIVPPAPPAPSPAAPAATPSPTPAPATTVEWSDEALNAKLSKMQEAVNAGKTADDLIAFYGSKATLTQAQQQRIRALKPAVSAAAAPEQSDPADPTLTYAQVSHALHHAKNQDEFTAARDGIRFVRDEQQRAELEQIADRIESGGK